jgi:hypothetical protein
VSVLSLPIFYISSLTWYLHQFFLISI